MPTICLNFTPLRMTVVANARNQKKVLKFYIDYDAKDEIQALKCLNGQHHVIPLLNNFVLHSKDRFCSVLEFQYVEENRATNEYNFLWNYLKQLLEVSII